MKILITGGAGYIGTQLLKALINKTDVDEIRVYDNLDRKNFNMFLGFPFHNGHKVKFIAGDILDARKLSKALEGVDVVYHLAANVSTPFSGSQSHAVYEQVNHWGTADLVSAVEDSQVNKFFYLSSASVYGHGDAEITEDVAPTPKTLYGISKLRGEEHVQRLFKKMDTYIVRCANVYGYSKSMRFDAVINRMMFDAHFNNRISIDGSGKQYRPFVHIESAVRTLSDILDSDIPSGIYNLSDRNMQILDVVDVLKEIYPDLEFIFVNQHLELNSLKLSDDSRLKQFITTENKRDFKSELQKFKSSFSFYYGDESTSEWYFNI